MNKELASFERWCCYACLFAAKTNGNMVTRPSFYTNTGPDGLFRFQVCECVFFNREEEDNGLPLIVGSPRDLVSLNISSGSRWRIPGHDHHEGVDCLKLHILRNCRICTIRKASFCHNLGGEEGKQAKRIKVAALLDAFVLLNVVKIMHKMAKIILQNCLISQ